MSIEMDNPQTTLEKVDAAWNLVEQMMLAHYVGDNKHFNKVHARATKLLGEAVTELDT